MLMSEAPLFAATARTTLSKTHTDSHYLSFFKHVYLEIPSAHPWDIFITSKNNEYEACMEHL